MSLMREIADRLDEFPDSRHSIRESNYMKELFYRFNAIDKALRTIRVAVREANEELPENNAMIYTNRMILSNARFLTWIENSLNLDYFPASEGEIQEILTSFTFMRSTFPQIKNSITAIPVSSRSRSFKAARVIEEVQKAIRHTDFVHEIMMNIYTDIIAGSEKSDAIPA